MPPLFLSAVCLGSSAAPRVLRFYAISKDGWSDRNPSKRGMMTVILLFLSKCRHEHDANA